MVEYKHPSYGQLAKGGFLLGLAMLIIGAGGEVAIHSHLVSLADWVDVLLFDVEVVGVLVFLLSPFVFGIFLPLVDDS